MALSNIVRRKEDPKVLKAGPSSLGAADRLARGLGWLGVGLGLAQMIIPHRLTRALGMDGKELLVRGFGARDIASGILTLSTEKQLGLWSRVAGDAMNIAALMPAVRAGNPRRDNAKLALTAVLGVTALDIVAARGVAARHGRRAQAPRSYSDRSGFPPSAGTARRTAYGTARASLPDTRVAAYE